MKATLIRLCAATLWLVLAASPAHAQLFGIGVTKQGSGQGEVTSVANSVSGAIQCGSTCGAPFPLGTVVNLVATPAPGSVFAGWSQDCSGTGDCSITVTGFLHRVTATFDAMPTNYTGLWWNAAESGWGVGVYQQGSTVFATLFTYDQSGVPLWLVMPGGTRVGGDEFIGDLYRTTGPAFNANPFTPIGAGNLTRVGSMRLAFTTPGNGFLTYTFGGVEVVKAIEKQVYGARATNCVPVTTSRASATNYQDLWWNPAESGWGIGITHQGDILFATLFTYGADGRGMWLVMSRGERQSDGSYSGGLFRVTGPAFNARPWTAVATEQVGTMRLRFTDGESGTLEYNVGSAQVTKTITRQVFGSLVPSCS